MSNQSKLAALASTGVTKAELNNIDGGTARGTTAVADGDGFLTNDGGTMRMTKVDTLATYMGTKIGGGMEFIASTDISNAATVSFTGFDSSKYDSYKFTFHNIRNETDGEYLRIRSSSDTSSHSYDSGSNQYALSAISLGAQTSTVANNTGTLFRGIGTGSGEIGISGTVEVFGAHLSLNTFFNSFFGGYTETGNIEQELATNIRVEDAQVNAVQFFMSAGNLVSGTITMYGIVNS